MIPQCARISECNITTKVLEIVAFLRIRDRGLTQCFLCCFIFCVVLEIDDCCCKDSSGGATERKRAILQVVSKKKLKIKKLETEEHALSQFSKEDSGPQ